MTIAKVDSILSKHPFFKSLESSTVPTVDSVYAGNRKVGIYNKVYTKIFYIRSNITVINPVTYSSDKSYLLYHENPEEVNLSAHKDVDSLMNEHSLLQGLTDEQKIAIFEIAAYRINMYRTLQEDQEYYFSTHKQDTVTIKKYFFQPLLSALGRVLVQTVRSYVYSPLATVTGAILSLFSKTSIFQPLLVASSKVWQFVSSTFTYIPLVNVTVEILQPGGPTITNIYLPLLTASQLILASDIIEVTYEPILATSTNVIVDVDYTETYTYEPILALTIRVG